MALDGRLLVLHEVLLMEDTYNKPWPPTPTRHCNILPSAKHSLWTGVIAAHGATAVPLDGRASLLGQGLPTAGTYK